MTPKVFQGDAREDQFTGTIEKGTSHVPSSIFLGLALGSMGAALILKVAKQDNWALFVGQWAAPFLVMGNYNKLLKQHGSDASQRQAA